MLKNLINYLYSFPGTYRKGILLLLDSALLTLSILIYYLLSPFEENINNNNNILVIWILLLIVSITIYIFTGSYKGVTRYLGSSTIYNLVYRNTLSIFICFFIFYLLKKDFFPLKGWIIIWILITSLTGITRFILRDLLISSSKNKRKDILKVAIYGAGSAGAQLSAALQFGGKHSVVAFLDDSKELQNRRINDVSIYSPKDIDKLPYKLDQILLAVPSASKERVKGILEYLKKYSIPVFKIPSIDEITSGKAKIENLSPITVEDLLGRDLSKPDQDLMGEVINGSIVCITGAAGSIGTELTTQILNLKPKKVIICDNSEQNLYFLGLKIEELNPKVTYKLILADVTDYKFLKKVFSTNKIDIVYHAAAYKHVPIVENNPIRGIYNNVFSTLYLCKVSKECGVKRFTLISSDKAVRPKNVMGATKRLAELIVQGYAKKERNKNDFDDKNSITIFSMVRFGNVLGSSGSVVPKFQSQINKGETLTLTHPEIVRYFMSISEAVQLVIQSSALAKGGEVFLLDMGEPILIKDIAKKLILLSGKTIKSEKNFNGDIEIKIIGLRPGEKLHEELLINSESIRTSHPLIYLEKAETNIDNHFWEQINLLEKLFKDQMPEKEILEILSNLIPEWNISDLIKKLIKL